MKKLLLLLALAVPLAAAAQSPVVPVKESDRWGSLRLSFSSFAPDIDSEFKNATYPPYATTFGTGRPLLFQVVFSKSAWLTEVGTLDVGFGAGFWQAWGTGFYQDTSGNLVRGGSTNLMIIPLQVEVSYRFDWFNDRLGVPLEPYARLALVDYIWSSSGQGGTSSWTSPDGQTFRASGSNFGWAGTLGVALVLDFFDTQLSRQMDYDTGINRTMLFFDFTKASVNDFGSKKSWQLAPGYWAWSAGLLFVF